MSSDIRKTVSPEYRARCIEWALQAHQNGLGGKPTAAQILKTAKALYEYVYEEPKH